MNSKTVVTNMIWRFLERCGAQCVTFFVTLILARLLEPSDYGAIALITVFTSILQVFVDSGMGNALIQKKDADDIDFSTVFYFNVVICVVLYVLLFFCAPHIAFFYNNEYLTSKIRVMALIVLISGVKNVQQAYVSKTMQFKRFFFSTLGGTIFAAIIGIALAYKGFGIWALIAQQLANPLMDTIILWFTVNWRPKKVFSLRRLRSLFNFGWKLLVSQLLNVVYTNIRSLIIGKMYSASDLAFYNQGEKIPNFLISNVNTAIDSVLLPTMASVQDDVQRVKNMTRRAIKTSSYVIAPMMIGICFIAEPLVRLLLTDKWIPSVFFMRIFCISFMFYPIHNANLNAINAMGRSDLFLKLEIIKKIMGLILLFSSMWWGVRAMAYSLLINCIMGQIINSWPNRRLLHYGYMEQLKDILPNICLATIMGICVYAIEWLGLNDIFTICIQVVCGITIYVGMSILVKIESFYYIVNIIKSFNKNKKYNRSV